MPTRYEKGMKSLQTLLAEVDSAEDSFYNEEYFSNRGTIQNWK